VHEIFDGLKADEATAENDRFHLGRGLAAYAVWVVLADGLESGLVQGRLQ
jgi:hypothetical protein